MTTMTKAIRGLLARGDMSDALSDLTPAEWRAVVAAAGQHRCVQCGEQDACECPDEDTDDRRPAK